jgi:hypothetical protein
MPGLEPRDSREGRTYTWGDESFWSVTTILKALNKPALPSWSAKMVAEYVAENFEFITDMMSNGRKDEAIGAMKGAPWRTKTKAADLGTLVHQAVEAYCMGVEQLPGTETEKHVGHFTRWLEAFKPKILETEVTVFNRRFNYAGTLDLLIELEPNIWVVDVKSGSGVYPEFAMQVAAYAHGEFIGRQDGTEDKMPDVTRGAVLHLRPNGYKFVPVDISDPVYRSFLHCRELFRFVEDIAPHVIMGEVRK